MNCRINNNNNNVENIYYFDCFIYYCEVIENQQDSLSFANVWRRKFRVQTYN